MQQFLLRRLRQVLYRSLDQRPGNAPRLWLEFQAVRALRHLAELRDICLSFVPTGCKVGIEHVGPDVFVLEPMTELAPHYVKIDSAIVDDIHAPPKSQALVRGLCTVAHSIGILIIAENCNGPNGLAVLHDLGVDVMTGKAVRASWMRARTAECLSLERYDDREPGQAL